MNTQGMIPLKENDSKKISDRYQKKTYAKGATCIYGDTLYRAKADITTAEEWTAAHWEETNMETIRAEMAAEVSSLNANKTNTYIGDKIYLTADTSSTGWKTLPRPTIKDIPGYVFATFIFATTSYRVKSPCVTGSDISYEVLETYSDGAINLVCYPVYIKW